VSTAHPEPGARPVPGGPAPGDNRPPPQPVPSAPPDHLGWRKGVDRTMTGILTVCGLVSVAVLVGIFVLLAVNAVGGFLGGVEAQPITPAEAEILGPEVMAELGDAHAQVPAPADLITDVTWRPDAHDGSRYGVIGLLVSTLLTTGAAMVLAVPVGVLTAAWLATRATGRIREVVKFGVELLAALPSVVIGFIGIQLTGPIIGEVFGTPGGLTALNGAVLLAIMALPTIISLSEDALSSVPRALVDGSLALGADRWQTLWRVQVPAARSGLFAAAMLGMGRAIGETMTVLMATGNASALPTSLLDPVRTLTATIAIELGEVPRGTTHYLMLFGVGLLLFLITLGINLAADAVVRRQERLLGQR